MGEIVRRKLPCIRSRRSKREELYMKSKEKGEISKIKVRREQILVRHFEAIVEGVNKTKEKTEK